ncbi:hypothetical protein [Herbaspirillum sp. SJZ107]|uniref:hypothetical protein n=1 Tax=Herbaspirillum sp. SJZ107 TaxID=2572881 RepID=UPI0011520EF2|nr:hypothetical protein [Herbaspirillum sp. SJZ107]TQK03186.1 hypothetical protein FBX97_4749 [Herbaspirillum sp. SJZ107]
MTTKTMMLAAALLAAASASLPAWAALPAPTPAQQQAADAKKAQAAAQAAKDKESLTASMDALSSRWRGRAAQQGWKTHPPVAIAAAAPAAAAPGSAAPAGASAGGIVTAAGAGGQQAGQLPASPANPIVKSEKWGTAPPSEDQKAGPTKAVPHGTEPTVQKGSPENVSKKK